MRSFVRFAVVIFALAGLIFPAGSVSAALVDGLAVYSSMEGATGATPGQYWEDISGNGRHVTNLAAPAYDGSSDFGGIYRSTAVSFLDETSGDNINDYQMTVLDGFQLRS